jgi:peptidoglycan/xylan/chitin deacetylase (PgdA/CDA1 family)
MNQGSLIISLDFELHWGRFDKYEVESYLDYYQNARKVVPEILDLFSKKGIHATWATVGMLMASGWEEWEAYKPIHLPGFSEERYSAYSWAEKQKVKTLQSLFAPELVREIINTAGQELASHTFSHYYTGMAGSEMEAFRADLFAAKKIAQEKFQIDLKSLVFPRNQYNDDYLNESAKAGFDYVRTNPSDWFWGNTEQESLIKKVFRTGDTLVPIGQKTTYSEIKLLENGQFAIPASRLLRPYRSNSIFNRLRVGRIKKELEFAAKNGLIYHLWWHPHNFGLKPKENLLVLKEIIEFVSELSYEYGLLSQTMEEIGLSRKKELAEF